MIFLIRQLPVFKSGKYRGHVSILFIQIFNIMEINRLSNYIIFSLGCLLFLCLHSFSNTCKPNSKTLYFYCDKAVRTSTDPGFTTRIYNQFLEPLGEIGYCLDFLNREILSDTINKNDMILYITMENESDHHFGITDSVFFMIINLISIEDWNSGKRGKLFSHPLISLSYEPEELSTFETVLIRKTIENLRTQYVCNLRIHSSPQGALIQSESGLEGITPLEWVLPVGDISIEASLDGYEQIRKKLDINDPGIHTILLQMNKRQFYNSKFIYPSVVFGLAAITCFIAEGQYYSKYTNLGKSDYYDNPEKFNKVFKRAKNCERIAIASTILCGISFGLTFIF